MKFKSELPISLGISETRVSEIFSYLYMPIKMPKDHQISIEYRLSVYNTIIGKVVCDYIGLRGLDDYINSYVYISAHNLFQQGKTFNRPGYHIDGYGTTDINYIWSNMQPTVINIGEFDIDSDDTLALKQLEEQARPENEITFPDYSILRLNQKVVHKVGNVQDGLRNFIKLSFSKDKYDLKGNTHNYLIDYNWKMRDRQQTRNTPQSII